MIQLLLSTGANKEATDKVIWMIHYYMTVMYVSWRFLSYLTLKGQSTPLIIAAREGCEDVVQLLLSAGANKEAKDRVILMIHYCMAVCCCCGPTDGLKLTSELYIFLNDLFFYGSKFLNFKIDCIF